MGKPRFSTMTEEAARSSSEESVPTSGNNSSEIYMFKLWTTTNIACSITCKNASGDHSTKNTKMWCFKLHCIQMETTENTLLKIDTPPLVQCPPRCKNMRSLHPWAPIFLTPWDMLFKKKWGPSGWALDTPGDWGGYKDRRLDMFLDGWIDIKTEK